jgi:hypothetical protein
VAEEQIIFNPSEMTLISYKCSNCNSDLTIDLRDGYRHFESCGVCNASLAAFSEVARHYESFLAKARDAGSVRMKMPVRPVAKSQGSA